MRNFRSKKDIRFGIVVWPIMALPLLLSFWADWMTLLFVLPGSVLSAWIWFGTGYTVTDTELKVRCGPFKETIPLEKISEVKKTWNLWSSAALSFDRLAIKHLYDTTYISPAEEEEFLRLLGERCPHASISVANNE